MSYQEEAGKGSHARQQRDNAAYAENYDKIFGKRKKVLGGIDGMARSIQQYAEEVKAMRRVLEMFAEALPEDVSTVKTCYAVNNDMRDAVHAVLKLTKES